MKRYVLDARTATDHFPGIGRYVSNLAQAMGKQLETDEQLILLRNKTAVSHWRLPSSSRQIVHADTAISPFGLAQQWQIPRLLRRHNAHCYHSPYYLMPYRPGVPTLVTIYDLIPQFFPQYVSLRARLLFQLATRLALRAADHIITISDATRADLLAAYAYAAEQITAVPLAPDPRFRPQSPAAQEQVREKYDLPSSFVLYLGINKPHKNLGRLLEAWGALDTAVPLVIAGAWDERYPEPKQKASALDLGDRVRFLGPVADADLPGLYTAAALFIFPSLYEGFGLPVVEAMACGAAVACSDRSSLPEVGGTAVRYFDPTAVNDIRQTVASLLNDPARRETLAQQGLAQAAAFSWAKTAATTLDIYRRLSQ